jgi:predicted DNA-binding transcriptional regulator
MKRILIWVDVKNEELEQVLKKLKESLNSIGVKYNIVDVYELIVEDTK